MNKKVLKDKVKIIEDYAQQNLRITDYIAKRDLGKIINDKMECPFHEDLSPSMYVDGSKNIYKCFSCGRGGGIISFHMYYRNEIEGRKLNYYEAIDDLIKQEPFIRLDTNIKTVFQLEDESIDITKPIELHSRFSFRNRDTSDKTLAQVIKLIKQRNDVEEILNFINDCMNEEEERFMITKYKLGRMTKEKIVSESISLEELMM